MKVAYTEVAPRHYWHVAWVDDFHLRLEGGRLIFAEVLVTHRECHHNGSVPTMVELSPPKVEITKQVRVADWFEVPEDTPCGVHKLTRLLNQEQ